MFPGVGQLYLGDTNKGIGLITGFILAGILLIVAFAISGDPGTNLLLAVGVGLVLFVIYIWQLFDAFNSAKRRNAELIPMGGR
jgi:TM2 domain-containing membrane protein YozV